MHSHDDLDLRLDHVSRAARPSQASLDLSTLRRRGMLAMGGAGLLTAAGFGLATARSAKAASASACPVIAEETEGPFPADGTNSADDGQGLGGMPPPGHPPGPGGPGGPPPRRPPRASDGPIINALMLAGIVRSDIRKSFAGATGEANGVPLTITLKLVNADGQCGPLGGYAVYLWHCDRDGRYSMYAREIAKENYLRGVQMSSSGGSVTFTTIFPACYAGRMPHIHFEVYASADAIGTGVRPIRTTQIALPVNVCAEVYDKASGYHESVREFASISFATDMVFADGIDTELATLGGSIARGYTANLSVGIAA